MRWPKRCRRGRGDPEVPTEEEGRSERMRAERGLREATDQWSAVHDVSRGLERVRRESGPDPFIEGFAQAMHPRHRHRGEAT